MPYQHILIVDDSSTSRMITRRCFEIAGFTGMQFYDAENGLDALSVLQRNAAIDLIVTDLNMPKMDGENFIKRIKQDNRYAYINIIVISSIAGGSQEEELKKAGVLAVIKKPLSPMKIKEAMGD